jgi:hypothetical protein
VTAVAVVRVIVLDFWLVVFYVRHCGQRRWGEGFKRAMVVAQRFSVGRAIDNPRSDGRLGQSCEDK